MKMPLSTSSTTTAVPLSTGGGGNSTTSSPGPNAKVNSNQHAPAPAPGSSPDPSAPAAPANWLNEMPWFHGNIRREEAEELLLNAPTSEDGLFLVRESTNFKGDYTLCVVFQRKVEHYRVIVAKNQLTIDEEEYFEKLTQLVEVKRK